LVKRHKEFFQVSLNEIEDVVRENFSQSVEFTRIFTAEDYRQTLLMKKALQAQNNSAGR